PPGKTRRWCLSAPSHPPLPCRASPPQGGRSAKGQPSLKARASGTPSMASPSPFETAASQPPQDEGDGLTPQLQADVEDSGNHARPKLRPHPEVRAKRASKGEGGLRAAALLEWTGCRKSLQTGRV